MADPRKPPEHPAMGHARMWGHVRQMHPDEIGANSRRVDYVLPILGALANDPNVTAKKVIKAAANAAADGEVDPSQAVKFVSSMPAEPEKLQPWLKGLYAANLSASVHMKAAQMAGAQQAAQPPQQAAPAPMAQPGGNPLAVAT